MANPLQERLAAVLLQRISSDRYPSATHMDMLESIASPEMRAVYALLLMERIENETNPSIPMMHRLERVISEFGT